MLSSNALFYVEDFKILFNGNIMHWFLFYNPIAKFSVYLKLNLQFNAALNKSA